MTVRIVTVVFTDLVGSTAIAARLGPDATEALRREHFACLRAGIARHGGREVKNLGDGLMVVFGSASEALAGAVAMLQAVDLRNRRTQGESLSVRVGVATGEADEVDGDYFGQPVVEAARLCDCADGGQVLATATVQALAGRSDITLRSLGMRELKGLADPVAVVEALWEPLADAVDAFGLPDRLASADLQLFVGRRLELDALAAVVKEASASRSRRLVLVSGEAGMGKTTLLTAFARRVHDEGAVVLYGRADEDLNAPYEPWVEALGQLLRLLPDDALAAHVAQKGGALAAVLGELGSRVVLPAPAAVDPESERFLLFGAVADLLTRATALGTVVVVLDDLQWADRPSLQLLRHLVSLPLEGPVMLVGSVRDTDVGIDHPMADLSAALHRETGVDRITLRGLDDAELLELLEQLAGHELDETDLTFRDTLLAETDGNPFYTREVVRHLVATGTLRRGGSGRWESADGVRILELPVSVREVVGRRVAGLGDAASSALSAAAVLGRDFDIDILEQVVSDIDAESLARLLDAAMSAAVLQEILTSPGRLTFAHALVQRTLYDDLTSLRRRRLHQRALDVLESMPGRAGPAELARHAIEALTPATSPSALAYALAAGDQALETVAAATAVDWYRRALDLAPPSDDETRADVTLRLAHAHRAAGDFAAYGPTYVEAGRLAERIGDGRRLAEAALSNTRGFASVGQVAGDRVAVIDAALAHCAPHDLATRARLLARLSEEVEYSPTHDRAALNDAAMELALQSNDARALVAAVRANVGWSVPETLTHRLALFDRHGPLVFANGTPFERFWLHYTFATALHQDARPFAEVLAEIDAAHDVVAEVDDPMIAVVSTSMSIWTAHTAGDLDAARPLGETWLVQLTAIGAPDAALFYGTYEIAQQVLRGQPPDEALVELCRSAVELPAFQIAVAGWLALEHRLEEASEIIRPMVAASLDDLPHDLGRLGNFVGVSAVAFLTRDREAARQLIPLVSPYRGQVAATSLIGGSSPAALALGHAHYVLGDLDAADADFAFAAEVASVAGIQIFVAGTPLERATVLLDRNGPGDAELARRLVEFSLEKSVRHGFGYVERDTRALLATLEG